MTIRNAIRTWAMVAVATSSAFTIGISIWLVAILSDGEWCTRILGAATYVDGRPEFAVQACAAILTINAKALGLALTICIGVQAICLAALVVIVLAGGKLSFKWNRDGVQADVARDGDVIRDGDEVKIEKE